MPAGEGKCLVLFSGGVDSTTLLAQSVADFGAENVYALSISYGQKHEKEVECARALCKHYGVQQRFANLATLFAESDCSLLGHSTQQVPKDSYADQLNGTEGMVSTYVPFRNGLFLSAAASMALALGCCVLRYGAHHDDWAGDAYPDCSPDFVESMARAINRGSGGQLSLEAPFVQWNKTAIVALGLKLGVPYQLTWS
ncbi:MAG: 7-cyano-7-deazaguanine synthase, partial [Coriobacteriia bacterium]|nr:7-cyano-7-deazaguanine synthase [Coriobacteriia bacterium]